MSGMRRDHPRNSTIDRSVSDGATNFSYLRRVNQVVDAVRHEDSSGGPRRAALERVCVRLKTEFPGTPDPEGIRARAVLSAQEALPLLCPDRTHKLSVMSGNQLASLHPFVIPSGPVLERAQPSFSRPSAYAQQRSFSRPAAPPPFDPALLADSASDDDGADDDTETVRPGVPRARAAIVSDTFAPAPSPLGAPAPAPARPRPRRELSLDECVPARVHAPPSAFAPPPPSAFSPRAARRAAFLKQLGLGRDDQLMRTPSQSTPVSEAEGFVWE